jgi:hypothetical protein
MEIEWSNCISSYLFILYLANLPRKKIENIVAQKRAKGDHVPFSVEEMEAMNIRTTYLANYIAVNPHDAQYFLCPIDPHFHTVELANDPLTHDFFSLETMKLVQESKINIEDTIV